MENETNNINQKSSNTSEELFKRLNEVIVSWFEMLKNSVWVLTIYIGLFALVGTVFFGYNLWEIQKELKVRLEEFEKTSKELNAKVAAIDSLRIETEDDLKRIAAHYDKNFEILRRELVKKANVKLSEDIVPYTPELKPRK